MIACFLCPRIAIAAERTRQPRLRGQAFGLLGPDDLLQCVSEEAALLGIQAGQTVSGARGLSPSLVLLPYESEIYREAASLLWDALAVESSVVEPVSPELCFAILDGSDVPERLRCLVRDMATAVQVPVQVGLGGSRLLAAQAAARADDGGPVLVAPGTERAFLAPTRLEALPALAPRLRARLERLGLRTLGDILAQPAAELRRALGAEALRLTELARGRDGAPIRPLWPPPSLETEIRFEEEVSSLPRLQEALRRCAVRLAARLQRSREFCRALTVVVTLEDGRRSEQSERLTSPLDTVPALQQAALRVFDRLRRALDEPPVAVQLRVSDLGIGSALQLELMDVYGNRLPRERQRALDATFAQLRRRFGLGAIVTARMLHRASRIHLWTYPLGRRLEEPVTVVTDARGDPIRFQRRDRTYEVRRIETDWHETEWRGRNLIERHAFRLETSLPYGIYEIHQVGDQWRLAAIND